MACKKKDLFNQTSSAMLCCSTCANIAFCYIKAEASLIQSMHRFPKQEPSQTCFQKLHCIQNTKIFLCSYGKCLAFSELHFKDLPFLSMEFTSEKSSYFDLIGFSAKGWGFQWCCLFVCVLFCCCFRNLSMGLDFA